MLISRKRKETKEITVYLNKPLKQVNTMKYLGIIIHNKFKFSEHIRYAAEKCTKLIHSLSKSAKISWGLKHGALKTIYKAAILPFLLYGAPVWIEALQYEHNRLKYIRVQRLIIIRIAKAYRKVSNEALCIPTGLIPIDIKIAEAFQVYHLTKGNKKAEALVECDMEVKYWQHPAETITFITGNNEEISTIQIFTDGSKSGQGVGAGVAIFKSGPTLQVYNTS